MEGTLVLLPLRGPTALLLLSVGGTCVGASGGLEHLMEQLWNVFGPGRPHGVLMP